MKLKSMFKFVVQLLVTLGLLTVASFGQAVDFSNTGGTLAGDTSGLVASSSRIVFISGLSGNSDSGAVQGTLSFSTGPLIDGTLDAFSGPSHFDKGGKFVIMSSGSTGNPARVLFSGSFDSPVTWSLTTLSNGTHSYTLIGSLTGSLAKSLSSNRTVPATGLTEQLTISTGLGLFNGLTGIGIGAGDTTINTCPLTCRP